MWVDYWGRGGGAVAKGMLSPLTPKFFFFFWGGGGGGLTPPLPMPMLVIPFAIKSVTFRQSASDFCTHYYKKYKIHLFGIVIFTRLIENMSVIA